MKNILITLLATAALGFGFMSCAALGGFFAEGTVFTTQDQLAEGEVGVVVPTADLPDSVKEKVGEDTVVVIANKSQLKDGAAFVAAGGVTDGSTFDGAVGAVFGIAKAFVPSLVAWEGVLTLFSQRKRQHYVKAVKAIVPTDKNVDLGGALASVVSAIGASHSSETTKETFAEELEVEAEE